MTAGTPSAEAVVTASDLRLLLEDQHPDLAPLAIEPIDAGWDNFMFRLGDDLAVRMPRRSLAAPLIVHEQDWLPVVAAGLPLTAPVPLRRGEPGQGYPWRWSIVPWLPGVPADQAAPLAGEARRWTAFLRALHRPAPLEAPKNTFRGVALAEKAAAAEARLSRLRATTSAIAPQIDMAWRRGLEAIPSQERLWLHGDLHAGNVLVDRGCLSGVIDWGDITSGDPATDLASTWALFADRSAREAVLSAYGAGAEQRMRAMAWAVFFGAVLLDSGRIDNPRHAAMGQSILKRVAQDV